MKSPYVLCPRYGTIARKLRTLIHLDDLEEETPVGEELFLMAHPDFPRAIVVTIVSVSLVRLKDTIDADLPLLACEKEEYVQSWDRIHPTLPFDSNPVVRRVEFVYGAVKKEA